MKDNEIKLLRTKAGKGFKVVVGDTWFYTSSMEMYKMMNGKSHAVVFRSITDSETQTQPQQEQSEPMPIEAWEEQLKALELKDLKESLVVPIASVQ